jgi:hypothetical protein
VVAREKMPTSERLWDDFTQEIREGSQCGEKKKKYEDEDNLSLAAKGKGRTRRDQLKELLQDMAARSLTPTKSSAFLAINLGILPANVPTRRRENPRSRWLLQLIWMHLQLDLKINFHS